MSKTRKIFGVFFKAPTSMPQEEVMAYAQWVRENHPHWMQSLSEVIITVDQALVGDGDDILLEYHFNDVPFERIRRITGYLVGNLNRFNDAKLAEVKDRKSHDVRI